MNADMLLQHFERISEAPDAVARLRRFILDLAVRGKLVKQDPNDEPASELLKRIARERARLEADETCKRSKATPLVGEEEKPFEVPVGWEWARLGDIGGIGSSSRVHQKDWMTEGVPFYRAREIVKLSNSGFVRNDLFIAEDHYQILSAGGLVPEARDLMITGVGTIGVPYIVRPTDKFYFKDASVLIFKNYHDLCPEFLFYFMKSPYWIDQIHAESMGTTVHTLTISRANEVPVALPPLAEQHRIVAKVDELMALCDQLEAAQNEREARRDRLVASSLHSIGTASDTALPHASRFHLSHLPHLTTRPEHIKLLRQAIMNLAVRGRLVRQDPMDEPAAELLKRIAAERTELVRKKEIRREETLDPIQATETPFEVPAQWIWSRIGDAVLFTQYGTSQKSHPSETGVPVLTMGNVQDGLVVWNNEKRIPDTSEDLPALFLRNFDLLYNRTNSAELVGKTGIYLGEDGVRTFASYLIRLRPSLRSTNPRFVNMAMNTPEFRATQIIPLIKKQTGQANVNGTALKNMLIPLPPLAEQQRIVAKVDELMALCDQLEAQLTTTQTDSRRLLEAVLRDALNPTMKEAA